MASSGIAPAVSARIEHAWGEHTAAIRALGDGTAELLRVGEDYLTGGKRLRARLAGIGWECAHQPSEDLPDDLDVSHPVVAAGAALEIFHAAALVHDDVMDRATTRRGRPAAHRRFAMAHHRAVWRGDADHFGEAAAILLGDLLLNVASMEFDRARADLPAAASQAGRAVWDLMATEVSAGQYLDIRAQAQPWGTVADPLATAMEVVIAKSARYSVEHPLTLGATLGGAAADLRAALARIGRPLGIAFQLRDDDLGVFGDPARTGKPAGGDLLEGKRTVLVALTTARLQGRDLELFRDSLGAEELTEGGVRDLQEAIVASGARDAHEELIRQHASRGLAELRQAGILESTREDLAAIADALVTREA